MQVINLVQHKQRSMKVYIRYMKLGICIKGYWYSKRSKTVNWTSISPKGQTC